MSFLVKDGSGLVLGVASAGQGRKSSEEEVAIDDVVERRKSISEDVGAAVAVRVDAVSCSCTAGGRSAIRSNSAEAGSDSAAGGGRSSLEVLAELGRGARRSSRGSSIGQAYAVAQSSADGSELGSGAVRGKDSSLLDRTGNVGSFGSINRDGKHVR